MRKMIVRIDDVGFTDVCNIGSFETVDKGIATSVDVMLDSPGTEDALNRLKAYPWVSVGWHMHMWGAPVLDRGKVSSLIEKDGEFAGRFRLDLAEAADVDFDEAVRELRAQLRKCLDILGRVPDVRDGPQFDTPWVRACNQVSDEFRIARNYAARESFSQDVIDLAARSREKGEEWGQYYPAKPSPPTKADGKWADRNIMIMDHGLPYIDLLTDSIAEVEDKYDPVLYYTEDRGGILKYPEDVIIQQAWHPGYVDYYVYRQGERGRRPRAQHFVVGRVQDVVALCDDRLKEWIRENDIELINVRDALYGTNEYQNHLKMIGSDLAVRR